ncbi:MAG: FtsH protease activity modulator HflK [Gammaproteobacteria bacterium]
MAWNQPGGQNNNPWGSRRPNNGSGGSNLDERVKDWQRRFESLFRPGGKGEGGALFITVLLLIVTLWLFSGFFQVKAAERGVIQRFGKVVLPVRLEGWGWRLPWPIDTVTKVNVANVNSSDFKSKVLTADVNLVEVRFAVQYRYADPIKKLFAVTDPEATLREVSESAIRQVVGQSVLDDVLVGKTRPNITRRTKELIQATLDRYGTGIVVSTVNLTDVQVPDPVIPSQRDANKALADQERFVKEAEAYSNSILPVAEGAAARLEQDALAYSAQVVALAEGQASRFSQLAAAYDLAPEITRKRLYLDSVENVLSRANKVIIDEGKGGTGNMIYLPLDKLLDRVHSNTGSNTDNTAESTGRVPPEPETVTVEGRNRGER